MKRLAIAFGGMLLAWSGASFGMELADLPAKDDLPKYKERVLNAVVPVDPSQIFSEIKTLEREKDSLRNIRELDTYRRLTNKLANAGKSQLEERIETVSRVEKCDASKDRIISDSAVSYLVGAATGLDEEDLRRYAQQIGTKLEGPSGPAAGIPSDKKCASVIAHARKLADVGAVESKARLENLRKAEQDKLSNLDVVAAVHAQRIEALTKLLEKVRSEKAARDQSDRAELLANNLWQLSLALGAIALLFIVCIRAFSETIQLEFVGSGQVIQFVTVLILLIIIMALGLAGIIEEKTLGTLLGGLAGYVLSQGIGRATEYRTKHTQPQPLAPQPLALPAAAER